MGFFASLRVTGICSSTVEKSPPPLSCAPPFRTFSPAAFLRAPPPSLCHSEARCNRAARIPCKESAPLKILSVAPLPRNDKINNFFLSRSIVNGKNKRSRILCSAPLILDCGISSDQFVYRDSVIIRQFYAKVNVGQYFPAFPPT